jgi:hypothetical protein
MVVDIKLKIEEARVTKEALTKMLAKKDKENEGLKIEVVSLRKKVQENNMNQSSQVLDQIISSQRSTYDKTGIGYKSAVTNGCSSSSVENRIIMRKLLTRRWNQKGKKKIRVQQCIEEVMEDIKTGLKAIFSFVISMDIRMHFVIVFQER